MAEVRRRLRSRSFHEPAVERAIAELEAQGYLDDRRYAKRFAEDRRTLDGWGSERIEQRLLATGVPRELIEAALAPPDGATELQLAVRVLSRRLREAPSNDRERNRALALLVRRGFGLELAYDAVRSFEHDRHAA